MTPDPIPALLAKMTPIVVEKRLDNPHRLIENAIHAFALTRYGGPDEPATSKE